jgi:hypothetical protein
MVTNMLVDNRLRKLSHTGNKEYGMCIARISVSSTSRVAAKERRDYFAVLPSACSVFVITYLRATRTTQPNADTFQTRAAYS